MQQQQQQHPTASTSSSRELLLELKRHSGRRRGGSGSGSGGGGGGGSSTRTTMMTCTPPLVSRHIAFDTTSSSCTASPRAGARRNQYEQLGNMMNAERDPDQFLEYEHLMDQDDYNVA